MAYQDTWHCPHCGAIYVEDDQMWVDPKRCPKCGAPLTDSAPDETTDTFNE